MRFGVLGPVTAWTDAGTPVVIQGLKVRALLANLLVHEGRPVPADRLIDDLWGSELPGNPSGTLSAKVSQLRRAFEDAEPGSRSLVQSGPAGYSLVVSAETYDALKFGELLAAGSVDEALALWRGPAYADFADDAFVETAVARLTDLRLTALEQADLPVVDLAALVKEHPLREGLRAAHMKALYRAGRQTEALESFDELRQLLLEDLGLDPSPELVALQQSILTQELPHARNNLPAQLTELIGRTDALADVGACLGTSRLVTLTGPGGVGKTRLALAAAADVAGRFADGVVLVELAAVTPDALSVANSLTDAVQAALDLRDTGGTPVVDLLASVMGSRLLVLDNCEQIVEEVAALTDRLLATAPGLRVLATSREPLGLAGEVVWGVPPLAVPPVSAGVEAVGECSAAQLFVTRAAAASRGFALTDETVADVAVLCRRLDGIPLALELAATRVRALGVRGLVARLDDRFRLLATGHRGAAPRQQTLHAMIDWSWELLAPEEQSVLRQLAVHADGCTAEAAAAVCGEDDVLDVLVRLVDRSLVVPVDGGRFRLLESVAAYCVEKLRVSGELESSRQRHLSYYVSLAEAARPGLFGDEQSRWLQLLDEDSANFRTALDRAVTTGQLDLAERLVDALSWYWFLRGRYVEAMRSLDTVPGSARAGVWRAGFMYLLGHPDAAEERDRWLDSADAMGQWWIAHAASDVGDLSACLSMLNQALKTFEADGNQWGVAAVLAARAKHAHVRADLPALYDDACQSIEIFRALGDRWGVLQATGWFGAHAELVGDFDEAERLHLEGAEAAEEIGLWPEVANALGMLGWTAIRREHYEQARTYGERALRLATEQGQRATQALAELVLGFAARRTGALDEASERLQALIDAARLQPESVLYLSIVLEELGFVRELQGRPDDALELHMEAFRVSEEFDSLRSMCWALEGIAACHPDKTLAATLLGSSSATRSTENYLMAATEEDDLARAVAAAESALGPEAYRAAFSRGEGLSPADAFGLLVRQ
ncbi:BTAD domain-containing putative transcriptional regulator [Kribbella sp. VKM Ac-2566]|uniref:BTAD domain-containing putative transcriptional regulator n=1 Tax=Kribbella sp. VKM Ac-2566 TaxID=2512218 RepID=UPI001063D5DA|nr:BTAD domain-containing putative transcriptional regulator [Kribbella sp. VKM Ac-2566]TDW79348.1 putative ATPase [Kribbella sp. VKM Ac-2566]